MQKNTIKVTMVIIGALIGAGFASGQEINVFFFTYGDKGIYGIIISNILAGWIIYKSLIIILENDINTYKEFLNVILHEKYKNIGKLANVIINIFVVISFIIMIAGFGAYFNQRLGIVNTVGNIILAIICFFIFLGNVKRVIKVSEILVPILIFLIIVIGITCLGKIDFGNIGAYIINKPCAGRWIASSILYSSYNSILLLPVLITLKNSIKNKHEIRLIAVFATIVIMILGLLIFGILMNIDVDINNLEMPAVYIVSKINKIFEIIYGFVILTSILTTSISLGISFLENFTSNRKSYTQSAALLCITAVFFSNFGFSNLVKILYPIFGYIGIFQILLLGCY